MSLGIGRAAPPAEISCPSVSGVASWRWSAADLDDVGEGFRCLASSVARSLRSDNADPLHQRAGDRHVHRGREHVVGRTASGVVVGVDRALRRSAPPRSCEGRGSPRTSLTFMFDWSCPTWSARRRAGIRRRGDRRETSSPPADGLRLRQGQPSFAFGVDATAIFLINARAWTMRRGMRISPVTRNGRASAGSPPQTIRRDSVLAKIRVQPMTAPGLAFIGRLQRLDRMPQHRRQDAAVARRNSRDCVGGIDAPSPAR